MTDKVKCSACGRTLKNPKSVQAGIGPTCAKKLRPVQLELPSGIGHKETVNN